MKRVLVTGAAGFTGRHLAAAFAQDGFEVHGLDPCTPARLVEGLAHLHACSLEDMPTPRLPVIVARPFNYTGVGPAGGAGRARLHGERLLRPRARVAGRAGDGRGLVGHRMQVCVDPALVRRHEARSLPGSRARLQALIGRVPELPPADTLRWMLEAPQGGAPASGAGLLAGQVGLDHH